MYILYRILYSEFKKNYPKPDQAKPPRPTAIVIQITTPVGVKIKPVQVMNIV